MEGQKVIGLPRGYASKVLDRLAKKGVFVSTWVIYKVASGQAENQEILTNILEFQLEYLEAQKALKAKNLGLLNDIEKITKEIA
jgi:hypothetical protein